MEQLLNTCKAVSGSDATFAWVSEEFLLDNEVQPWSEVPLWLPESDPAFAGFNAFDCRQAIAAGLTFRPLADTVRDTLAWEATRPDDHAWRAGLTRERESELLFALLPFSDYNENIYGEEPEMSETSALQWEIDQLVKARLFPNEQAVLRSALRALFESQPKLRRQMVVRAYTAGEISLGKAAEVLGVSHEEMKDILREEGAQIHLGPRTADELLRDTTNA